MTFPVTVKFWPTNTLPPTPKPPVPGTTIAPVMILVLGIRLLATMAPPAQILPPTPSPPGLAIRIAPVVLLTLVVFDDITKSLPSWPPPNDTEPPTFKLPLIPTPPTTCSAPVLVLVLSSPLLTTNVPMFSPVIGLMLAMVAPLTSIQ